MIGNLSPSVWERVWVHKWPMKNGIVRYHVMDGNKEIAVPFIHEHDAKGYQYWYMRREEARQRFIKFRGAQRADGVTAAVMGRSAAPTRPASKGRTPNAPSRRTETDHGAFPCRECGHVD